MCWKCCPAQQVFKASSVNGQGLITAGRRQEMSVITTCSFYCHFCAYLIYFYTKNNIYLYKYIYKIHYIYINIYTKYNTYLFVYLQIQYIYMYIYIYLYISIYYTRKSEKKATAIFQFFRIAQRSRTRVVCKAIYKHEILVEQYPVINNICIT